MKKHRLKYHDKSNYINFVMDPILPIYNKYQIFIENVSNKIKNESNYISNWIKFKWPNCFSRI